MITRTIEFKKMVRRDGKWYYHDLPLDLFVNSKKEIFAKVNGLRFYLVSDGVRLKDYTSKRKKDG